jgi:hypothetical protein
VAANTGRDGIQSSAQVDDLRAETAQGSRLVLAGTALFDQGPQGGVAIEGCPAEAGHRGDVGEGDGVASGSEVAEGSFDTAGGSLRSCEVLVGLAANAYLPDLPTAAHQARRL